METIVEEEEDWFEGFEVEEEPGRGTQEEEEEGGGGGRIFLLRDSRMVKTQEDGKSKRGQMRSRRR